MRGCVQSRSFETLWKATNGRRVAAMGTLCQQVALDRRPVETDGAGCAAAPDEVRRLRALLSARLPQGWVEEPSVKLRAGRLETSRRLFSFSRDGLRPASRRRLAALLTELGMPRHEEFLEPFAACRAVHLGVEGSTLKCYLEFPDGASIQPDLAYRSAKWRAGHVRYDSYFDRSAYDADLQRALIASATPCPDALEAGQALLAIARAASDDGRCAVLEVLGERDSRRSVDINLADAGRTIASLRSVLAPVLAPAGGAGVAFLDDNAAAQLGHFAMGHDETGRGFVTLYFGARVT